MLPFCGRSSDSDPADEGAPATVEHQKPSLRILVDGPATREDDLLHGPLLLRIGDGVDIAQHGCETMRPPAKIEELEHGGLAKLGGRHELASLWLPFTVPPIISQQTMPQSESSAAGEGSFSLPTEGTISTNRYVEYEAQTAHSTSHDGGFWLFARRAEFTWTDSCLLFAGEPLYVDGTAKKPSSRSSLGPEIGSDTTPNRPSDSHPVPEAQPIGDPESYRYLSGLHLLSGVGGLVDSSPACDAQFNLDVECALSLASDTSSCSDPFGGPDLNTRAADSTLTFITTSQTIERVVILLHDHYVRSFAPQGTGEGSQRTSGRREHCATHGTGTTPRIKKRQVRRATKRHGRNTIDGNGESEDSDSQRKRRRSSYTTLRKRSLVIVCPFLRWDPVRYERKCSRIIRCITTLKRHLRVDHYEPYCSYCYTLLGEGEASEHCCKRRPITAPLGLVTDEMVRELEVRADKTKEFKEQWYDLYTMLLPGVPVDFRPFCDDRMLMALREAENYVRSEENQELMERELRYEGFKGQELVNIRRYVSETLFPRVVEHALATSASGTEERSPSGEVFFGSDQKAAAAPGGQNVAPVVDAPFLHHVDHVGFCGSTVAMAYPMFELEEQPESGCRSLNYQPGMEGSQTCYPQNTTESKSVVMNDLETDVTDILMEPLFISSPLTILTEQ